MQRADNEGNFFLFFFRFFSFFGSFFILDNFSGAWQQLNRRLHGETERERDGMQKREQEGGKQCEGERAWDEPFFVSRRSVSSFARLLDFFLFERCEKCKFGEKADKFVLKTENGLESRKKWVERANEMRKKCTNLI